MLASVPMRSPALLLLAAALALPWGDACAQEQESQLVTRLLRPNTDLEFTGFGREFNGQKAFNGSGRVNLKSFYFSERFQAQEYLTGAYYGQQTFWRGDFQYRTKEANTEANENVRRMQRDFATREVDTVKDNQTARDAAKSPHDSGRKSWDSGKSTAVIGRSQARFDKEGLAGQQKAGWTGDLTEIKTVEDIRNLLNKDQDVKK